MTTTRRVTAATMLLLASTTLAHAALPVNPGPPASPVRLVFIHHSTGQNWLADGNGGFGLALRDANYFVSDTNYGWGPADVDAGSDTIGDHTDIGHWYSWFSGPNRDGYLSALYADSGVRSGYSRLGTNPGGENRIVLFKSCFPNSAMGGSPADPVPPIGSNPLRGQAAGGSLTVANAKGIYIELLKYFATRTDKLFVVVTAPPLVMAATNATQAANARAFNDWLVNDWLSGYPNRNVAVLDFYDVLTSDGGSTRTNDPNTNDLGWADGNHHRVRSGAVEHVHSVAFDYSAYGASTSDSHPTRAGNLKATGELVPLLNVAYHCWVGDGGCPGAPSVPTISVARPSGGESWPAGSRQGIQWTASALSPGATVELSWTDGAATYAIASVPPTQTTYVWTVPNTTTSAGRVIAVSRVSGAPEASGQSAGAFAVVPAVAPAPAPDLDGDGKPELLWHQQSSGELYAWRMNGAVVASGASLSPSLVADTAWQVRGLADFDGDGKLDLLWHNQRTGALYAWLMNGLAVNRGVPLTPSRFADTLWQIRGVADLNGDRRPDLVWHHQATGDLYVWYMNGTAVASGSYLTPSRFADTQWQIRAVVDMNRDGQPDLVWHHQKTGEVYVWFLSGTSVSWGSYLSPAGCPDAQWKVARVADVDGNGQPDLLWRHQATGELYVWLLDGVVASGGGYLTPRSLSDGRWQIVPR